MAGAFPILFVTAPSVRDAVFSSGLLKRLHDEIPNARFTIVAGAASAPLFRDTPRLDRLIVAEKAGMAVWNATRNRRWGLILDVRGPEISRYLSARKRSVAKPLKGEPGPIHRLVEYARLLKLETEPPAPYLFVSPETQAQADALLGSGGPLLAVAPGASWVGKAWPPERYNEIAAKLLRPGGAMAGGRLLILGQDAERDATHTIRFAAARDRLIDATGKLDPLQAYACLGRTRLYLGGDIDTTVIAAAAGAPTLALFGPSDERIDGPWGPAARIVRGPRELAAYREVDPALNQAISHMLDLSVNTVFNAATRLLAETEDAGA